jgi:diguanylate cyclase (GGDEF)-like protein/PAS domain S-box-containing protein
MGDDGDIYRDIVENLYDGVYIVDRERVITYWNKGAERITGYTRERVLGHSCRDNLLNHVTADGVELCLGLCPLAACMQDGVTREADVFVHHADGHRVPVMVRAAPLRDAEGRVVGAVETFSSDLGLLAVRQELRELRHSVQTDALTGIANRSHLEGRLQAHLAEQAHQKGAPAGVLFADIDHFKRVNDLRGHDVGDAAQRMVAETLRHNMRRSDVVGRWGGEEFVAILYSVADEAALRAVAEKLRTLTAHSRLDLDTGGLAVTISIGATLVRLGDTSASVVQRADELMYASKQAGRNKVTVG